MKVSIFTFPFEPGSGGFDTYPLEQFCLDKHVLEIVPYFFQQENQAYWTVLVRYRLPTPPAAASSKERVLLSEKDQLLAKRLKEWRSLKAKELGWPPYLIFTQHQLMEFVRMKMTTKEGFGPVKGFGTKKIKRFGEDILTIIQAFTAEES
ncbi:MAG: HRDC domain-containing protein [Bacteroidota bacterium]